MKFLVLNKTISQDSFLRNQLSIESYADLIVGRKNYVDYLIELVPPYYENFGKQAMKSPKLYFTDVGLVAYLLEIETLSQIDQDFLKKNYFFFFTLIIH